ncbi:MAG: hypothetical protein PHF29_06060 [Candidatus Riflebacteria bacterium]|nr:hypothetical protein [Candidatus Riflebacteria bacterium]
MKLFTKSYLTLIFLCCVLFLTNTYANAETKLDYKNFNLLENVTVKGNVLVRTPFSVYYEWLPEDAKIPENSVIQVIPDAQNPLASDSAVVIGSHTITLFPAASLRLTKEGITPLTGRINLNTQEENFPPVVINTRKCHGEYYYGNLFIEMDPEDNIFIAMQDNGKAWFKDNSLTVYELNDSFELLFPLYGATTSKRRVSSFWKESPKTFGNLK